MTIKKMDGSLFRMENWNAGYCVNFYELADLDSSIKYDIRDDIIGWCRSSTTYCRPRNDEEFVAIMLKDESWCHLPMWAIKNLRYDNTTFWNFEGFNK